MKECIIKYSALKKSPEFFIWCLDDTERTVSYRGSSVIKQDLGRRKKTLVSHCFPNVLANQFKSINKARVGCNHDYALYKRK